VLIAKIIMKAAVEHFTPVILELGSKSPVYIDEDANMDVVARCITFGKIINAGQTCVAPGYVLLTAKGEGKFHPCNEKSDRQFERLSKLLHERESGEIAMGGESDERDLYMAPTILTNVGRDDKIMEDETFGPILPVIRVSGVDDATEYINSKNDPLVLYIFSDKKVTQKIMDSISSGEILVNDILMHAAKGAMPFGGVGAS
ncbi:aldehyde dehydrogenase 3, member A2, partial [Mortierella sp. AM989]